MIAPVALVLGGCGEAGPLEGVGERSGAWVIAATLPTTTAPPVVIEVGEEGLVGDPRPDRAPDECLLQPVGELVAVELLARAVVLDDHQAGRLDTLVRGVPPTAGKTFAPPPDGRTLR